MNKTLYGILKAIEVGGIIGLTGFAIRQMHKCDKIENELLTTKIKLGLKQIECVLHESENRGLKKQLEELQTEEEA